MTHVLSITELTKVGSQGILAVLQGERSPSFHLTVDGESKYLFLDLDQFEATGAVGEIGQVERLSFDRFAKLTARNLEEIFSKADAVLVTQNRKDLFALCRMEKVQRVYEKASLEYQNHIQREIDEKGFYH